MNAFWKYRNHAGLIVLFIFLLVNTGCKRIPGDNLIGRDFQFLREIRAAKKERIITYFAEIKNIAKGIASDKSMLDCFYLIKKYYQVAASGIDDVLSIQKKEYEADVNFVTIYKDFYDILFVDSKGFIFHSIKQEDDYHTNLFTGRYSDTSLARHLKEVPEREFVSYEFYPPSDEPAAFFVVPVYEEKDFVGWFVLQFPINKINAILSDHENLGRTGEVYLVNENKLMLTDSRFIEDSTILKRKVDTEAVKLALRQKTGDKIIKDYRGINVLSTFEQFEVFGQSWIIIVEIDEDEVVSKIYKEYEKYFLSKIVDHLPGINTMNSVQGRKPLSNQKSKRVDINEYAMTKSGEILETKGVGPCTTVIFSYPRSFGYLAHISPVDEIYHKNPLTQYLLGNRKTSYLRKILQKIRRYDLYPYQLNNLHCVIVATHTKSLETIIDQLLKEGIELSQISFFYNPSADYANIIFDQLNDCVNVEWKSHNYNPVFYSAHIPEAKTLGHIMKEMMPPHNGKTDYY
ncbi:MAG: hypothetical protein E3K37_00565 [Candidatus Kuenenia sp.]|nr:hypothetical protein [Candidatus Kuenenia hertensis]